MVDAFAQENLVAAPLSLMIVDLGNFLGSRVKKKYWKIQNLCLQCFNFIKIILGIGGHILLNLRNTTKPLYFLFFLLSTSFSVN
jgi:hypothetical protein